MSTLKLTNNNYYSEGANKEYLSVSQYKDFYGTLGQRGCEAQALAKISGKFNIEPTTAMLVGSYVDSYFEGSLEEFKERTPELFKKDGTLKADYKQAEDIIARIERDKKFMQYMSGEKQTIMTGEFEGAQWKIKMDSYIPDKAIVDLKVVDDIYKSYYHRDTGKLNFIQERGVTGVANREEELNEIIRKFSIGWDLNRISRLARSIMQLAIYEIEYLEDVPTGVAVSEAVRIAKKYDGTDTGSFINGILGSFARSLTNTTAVEETE